MKTMLEQAAAALTLLRERSPLIHNITNYVTVNDCANVILAAGGSPIMADDSKEAEDITKVSSALVLNIGTLNSRTVESMLLSGKKANELHIPVVFDPVGAGASALRVDTAKKLLQDVEMAVIRGNLSEISSLGGLVSAVKGVDVGREEEGRDGTLAAKTLSKLQHAVVAVTGKVDVITDGRRFVKIHNGHSMLSRVTGTGCMTTALVGAYLGATLDPFLSAVAGVTLMGIAGEIAFEETGNRGTGSFRAALMDAVSMMTEEIFLERAKLDETCD